MSTRQRLLVMFAFVVLVLVLLAALDNRNTTAIQHGIDTTRYENCLAGIGFLNTYNKNWTALAELDGRIAAITRPDVPALAALYEERAAIQVTYVIDGPTVADCEAMKPK